MDFNRELLWPILRPTEGWRRLAEVQPSWSDALLRMLVWRLPFAFLQTGFLWSALHRLQGRGAELATRAQGLTGQALRPEDLKALLEALPQLPSLGLCLLLTPLLLLSAWMHHMAWDHGCLWMLGGLKSKGSWKLTALAEAQAMRVGSVDSALGLLQFVPWVGPFLGIPLLLVSVWFWIQRGFSMAAHHGCPPWKGVAAVLLHALLATCCVAGTFFLSGLLLMSLLS